MRDVTAHDHLSAPWRRLSHAAVRYLSNECIRSGDGDSTDEDDDSSADGELDESSLWDLSGRDRCSTPPHSGPHPPPFRYVLVSPSTQSSATTRHSAAS